MGRPKGNNSNARQRLLEAAGRGFRTGGFGGLGVDGLAKDAGLTSGAFYSHFSSKADAFKESLEAGFDFFQGGLAALREAHGERWPEALVDFYFGERMEVPLCEACVLPSLTADVARAGEATRVSYAENLRKLADSVAEGLPSDPARARAWVLLALFAGGAGMARAVGDESLREEILTAVRAAAHQV